MPFDSGPSNRERLQGVYIPTYRCPSEIREEIVPTNTFGTSGFAISSYSGNFGTNAYHPGFHSQWIMGPYILNVVMSETDNMPAMGSGADFRSGWYGVGVFCIDKRLRLQEITDGLSNTVLVFENRGDNPYFKLWAGGPSMRFTLGSSTYRPNLCNKKYGVKPECLGNFGSLHSGGLQSVFADGSVRFISNSIESSDPLQIIALQDIRQPGTVYRTWQQLSVINDGGVLADF